MNPFESLCKLASKENWCWNIYCTTCGHMHFRYAFREIAHGVYPDSPNWIITSGRTHYDNGWRFNPRDYSEDQIKTVLQICMGSNLKAISNNCEFPDWLGYLGLVLHHFITDDTESQELSKIWAKQLMSMVPEDSISYMQMSDIVLNRRQYLTVSDLELIEQDLKQGIFKNWSRIK